MGHRGVLAGARCRTKVRNFPKSCDVRQSGCVRSALDCWFDRPLRIQEFYFGSSRCNDPQA